MSTNIAPLVKLNRMISMGMCVDVECKIYCSRSGNSYQSMPGYWQKAEGERYYSNTRECYARCPGSIATSEIHYKCAIKSHQESSEESDTTRYDAKCLCTWSVARLPEATKGIHVIIVRPLGPNCRQDPNSGSMQLTTLIGTLPEKHLIENAGSQE